jgi:topoisomerase-4 subunit A
VQTVTKRLNFRLDKILSRLHILEGLLIAYLNIDEVIKIIRYEDEPKIKLMKKFKLTELQAESILELKLRHLAKLEEIQITQEQKELDQEKLQLEKLLGSDKLLKNLIKQELKEDSKKFGDTRRSPIVTRSVAQVFQQTELVSQEPMTVVLSEMGWIRSAKGHEIDAENLSYKSGDKLLSKALANNHQQAIFIDSTGRTYSQFIYTLPSARGQGEPLTGKFNPPSGANFVGLLAGEDQQKVVLGSTAGYGFVTTLSELYCKNKAGKVILKCPEKSTALIPCYISNLETDLLAVVSNTGQLLIFPANTLPELPRGKGNKLLALKKDEKIAGMAVVKPDQHLIIYNGSHKLELKPHQWAHYKGDRAKRGGKLPRGFLKVDGIRVR